MPQNKPKIPKREGILLGMLIAMLIAFLGGFMNMGAVASNQGKMPVNADYNYETETHISYKILKENTGEIENIYLTDYLKKDFSNGSVLYYSIGDILLLVFGIIFVSLSLWYCIESYKFKKEYKLKNPQIISKY